MKTMGQRLREIRKSKKMTGPFVAQNIGISVQYYYDMEKDRKNLGSENATKLANLFKVTTDFLLGQSEDNLYDFAFTAEEREKNSLKALEPEAILDLSNVDVFERYSFKVDGQEIDDEEARGILAYLRAVRKMKK